MECVARLMHLRVQRPALPHFVRDEEVDSEFQPAPIIANHDVMAWAEFTRFDYVLGQEEMGEENDCPPNQSHYYPPSVIEEVIKPHVLIEELPPLYGKVVKGGSNFCSLHRYLGKKHLSV